MLRLCFDFLKIALEIVGTKELKQDQNKSLLNSLIGMGRNTKEGKERSPFLV